MVLIFGVLILVNDNQHKFDIRTLGHLVIDIIYNNTLKGTWNNQPNT